MDELLQMVYPDASEYVDWHTLLVTLAQPYPIPSTQDLLNALNSYRAITNGDVLMSRDQYDKVCDTRTAMNASLVSVWSISYTKKLYYQFCSCACTLE